ncbi:MAG: ATP dependent DNA ligase [Candidatus Dormibacteria bacterium]
MPELPATLELPLDPPGLPDRLEPMSWGSTSPPFDSPDHVFEVNWAGLRAMAACRRGEFRLWDAGGRDLGADFPDVAGLGAYLAADSVLVDGVLVAADASGLPSHEALERRLALARQEGVAVAACRQPVAFVAFDLLYVEGASVMGQSLLRRRRALGEVVRPGGPICVSEHVAEEGEALFEAARLVGLPQLVAKRRQGRYLPGRRSPDWALVREVREQDAAVIGFVPEADGGPFRSLLVGFVHPDGAQYAGEVGGGFDPDSQRRLERGLRRARPHPGAAGAQGAPEAAVWVEPEISVRLKFSEWSREGRMRFPVFMDIRDGVDPRACRREGELTARPAPAALPLELPQLPFPLPD